MLKQTRAGRLAAPAAHRAREIVLAGRAALEDRDAATRRRVEWLSRNQPIPPGSLRVKVQRNASALSFLNNGLHQHEFITDLLARNDIDLTGSRVLDFGCGCGKNLRWWWPEGGTTIVGSDVNPKLAGWCDANLPFVSAVPNDPMPPLPFDSESFDFLYSISIFTHFPEDRQLPWIDEVKRVVRPGGVAMITVAGEAYAAELSAVERRAYDAGRLVVRFGEQPGSNLCAVYHPPAYVQETLIGDFELLEYVPGDPEVKMRQDTYLLRRPS